jgi:hypothetical protein
MAIISIFYAAVGYLALLGAILWGMVFFGDSVVFPNMDAAGSATPLEAAFIDLGLLLLLALLHRSLRHGMLGHFARRSIPRPLERSTQAWAAAAVLALIYAGWQPLPQILWKAAGPLHWALSALFYIAWTVILIGTFLASHLELFEIAGPAGWAPSADSEDDAHAQSAAKVPFMDTLRQPLYGGILMAVWATPAMMTVGHLLLAVAVTAYLLLDGLWAPHKSGGRHTRAVARDSQAPASHSRATASRVSALSEPSEAASDTAA